MTRDHTKDHVNPPNHSTMKGNEVTKKPFLAKVTRYNDTDSKNASRTGDEPKSTDPERPGHLNFHSEPPESVSRRLGHEGRNTNPNPPNIPTKLHPDNINSDINADREVPHHSNNGRSGRSEHNTKRVPTSERDNEEE